MERAAALAVAVTGLSALAGGAGLLLRRRALLTGCFVALAGLLLLVPVVGADARPDVWVAAAVAAATAGLVAFPRLSLRAPLDLLAVAVGAAGLLTVLATAALPGPRADTVRWTTTAVALTVLGLHTWWRLERAGRDERRQLLWMALPVAVAVVLAGLAYFAAPGIAAAVTALCCAVVPACLYVGASRPDLVDVRGFVVPVLVHAGALFAYIALLATALASVEMVTGAPAGAGLTLVVAALCALAVHPAQVVLRGVVDAVLFGRRPDPLLAASEVAGTIGDDPAVALDAVREALVLPYAAVRVDGAVVAASGTEVTTTRAVPLPLGDAPAAELVVGLRPGELSLPSADQQVLRLVAPLLAQTLRARAAAAEVATSREAVIQAVEEERRRLRRDLHDGLGPVLSGIAFTTDAARNTLRSDPATADELLAALRAEAVGAIGGIRRLVYGMRPPALDELGLVPALRQHAATLRTADERPLRVTVETRALPELPAAWEVAAYRIVVAALDNAARHSGSDTASACLGADDGSLVVEVHDGGTDPADGWRPGVGVSSMRERAAELGGTLTAGPSDRGWQVRAVIPLPAGSPTGLR